MIFSEQITDIHTHRLTDPEHQILSVEPGEEIPANARYISVGRHPWHADRETSDEGWAQILADPRLVAIGETGLDKLRGPDLVTQERELRKHVALSEKAGLPLIIHCVKAFDRLIALKQELKPRQRWVIHGFRGGEVQARQLMAHGLLLSFGTRYNDKALEAAGSGEYFRETD
ncbi:MAG: TatD family hydrolase [Muribaculaceae bacterium]|nr:TatD family hydrolase [Muribaculaceae bacterium]